MYRMNFGAHEVCNHQVTYLDAIVQQEAEFSLVGATRGVGDEAE